MNKMRTILRCFVVVASFVLHNPAAQAQNSDWYEKTWTIGKDFECLKEDLTPADHCHVKSSEDVWKLTALDDAKTVFELDGEFRDHDKKKYKAKATLLIDGSALVGPVVLKHQGASESHWLELELESEKKIRIQMCDKRDEQWRCSGGKQHLGSGHGEG